VDERLGIPENKAMRLLTTKFFTLLLIGSAGGSYGQTVETINYADGDIYAGEWKDGQQNGLGVVRIAATKFLITDEYRI
jgi:hypothetical protein